jgi:FMN phosphatase YigB (HAD superfamily)
MVFIRLPQNEGDGGIMKLAIFDFDGTLFPKDTLPFLLSQWKELKRSRFTYYKTYLSMVPLFIKYKLEIVTKLSREQMKVLAVRKFNHVFSGMTEKELMAFFAVCSQKVVETLNESIVRGSEESTVRGVSYCAVVRDL